MNIWNDLPSLPLAHEESRLLARSNQVRIERIISTGQSSDWYDQEETEFLALLSGTAKLEFEDGRLVELQSGDTLVLQPHQRHKVACTSTSPPCIWLCVFYT